MAIEKPIIFNAEMVRALRAGNKTQTRRLVRPRPLYVDQDPTNISCPYGFVGSRLWVRETYAVNYNLLVLYKADFRDGRGEFDAVAANNPDIRDWKTPLYMPREKSRLLLEITSIRLQRVRDITEDDAYAEGIPPDTKSPRLEFMKLWESIHGKGSWEANQWVWAIGFNKLFDPVDVEPRNIWKGK